MVFIVFIYSLVEKKFKLNMLEGSLIIVGYGEDLLQSYFYFKLEDLFYSWFFMGKFYYIVSFILNWKIYLIVGFLWGSFNIGEVL